MMDIKLEKLLKWANTTYRNEEVEHRKHYKAGYKQAVSDIINMYNAYKVQSSCQKVKK